MNAELPRPPQPNGTLLIVLPLAVLLFGAIAFVAAWVNWPSELPLWLLDLINALIVWGPLIVVTGLVIFAAVLAALRVNRRVG